mgnify:CR=1 FL=1
MVHGMVEVAGFLLPMAQLEPREIPNVGPINATGADIGVIADQLTVFRTVKAERFMVAAQPGAVVQGDMDISVLLVGNHLVGKVPARAHEEILVRRLDLQDDILKPHSQGAHTRSLIFLRRVPRSFTSDRL